MTTAPEPVQPTPASFFDWSKDILLTWTPRVIVAVIAGYYSLGIAYDTGLMAEIDKIAIQILKHWVGYAGIGALMPTFQWYSALAVRMVAATVAGLLYDLIERLVRYLINAIWGAPVETEPKEPLPADAVRA